MRTSVKTRTLMISLWLPTHLLQRSVSRSQADAYKKYVLLCLKVHGDVKPLPVYTSHILQRYSKSSSTWAEAFHGLTIPDIRGEVTSMVSR